jgi:hypothetical protein
MKAVAVVFFLACAGIVALCVCIVGLCVWVEREDRADRKAHPESEGWVRVYDGETPIPMVVMSGKVPVTIMGQFPRYHWEKRPKK